MSNNENNQKKIEHLRWYYQEHDSQARKHEDSREKMSSIVISLVTILTGLVTFTNLSLFALPLSVFISVLGCYGYVTTQKHYERNRYHIYIKRELRNEMEYLVGTLDRPDEHKENMTLEEIRDRGFKLHLAKYGKQDINGLIQSEKEFIKEKLGTSVSDSEQQTNIPDNIQDICNKIFAIPSPKELNEQEKSELAEHLKKLLVDDKDSKIYSPHNKQLLKKLGSSLNDDEVVISELKKQARRIARIRLHELWQYLYFFVIFLGCVLSLLIILNSCYVKFHDEKSPTKVEIIAPKISSVLENKGYSR